MNQDPTRIKEMFAKVAPKYDLANDVLSLGIHHLWRKKLVQLSGATPGQSVLDCATGTGDLAIEFKKVVGASGSVIASDFCAEMLESSPAKAQKNRTDIRFEVADVVNLPYKDSQFDFVSISFGIRNVGDVQKALREMYRVCKPSGKVMILEFGQLDLPLLGSAYQFYSKHVLPTIGGWVTGQKEAYSYLQKSSAEFPCRDRFLQTMTAAANFKNLKWHSLSFGIAYIYEGTK